MANHQSQTDRVLAIMNDGFWHTPLEFAQLSRPILRLAARIYDLKKQGHQFEREYRIPHSGLPYYAYRLVC